jgi:uncharacterized protein YjdB
MLAIATLVMVLVSCTGDEENLPDVEMPSLKVTPATLILKLGEKGTVGANIAPVTWSSSAAEVAAIDASSGEITALATGTATVTAKGTDGKTATGTVTVIHIPLREITIKPNVAEIFIDSTLQLNAVLVPTNATNYSPVWTSSDTSVVTVSQTGLITGILPGTATVTVASGDISYAIEVRVKDVDIIVSPNVAKIFVDSTLQFNVAVLPANAAVTINWNSGDESIVTVSKTGLITGMSKGTATVTVSVRNVSKSVEVTVLTTTPFASWSFEDPSDLAKANVNDGVQGIPLGLVGELTSIAGPSSTNKAVRLAKGSNYLEVFHGMLPSGASYVADWTIMVVFKMPEIGAYHSILQTDVTGTNDADFFVSPNSEIGIGALGYVGPALEAEKWYRLIISRKDNLINSYVNGVQYHNGANASDGRFSLQESFLISQDEDGEDNTIDVAEIAVWKEPLSKIQIDLIETEQ